MIERELARVRVRPLEATDLDRVASLEQDTFANPQAREALAAELRRSWARVLVADHDRHGIVAFVNYWLVADEIHVLNVATDPSHRRNGYGRLLMLAVLEGARVQRVQTILLEVRVSNEPALALYRSMGFAVIDTRKRYYDDGEDAYVMTAGVR